jgi:DNA-binding NarL/FixJ family response regulator
MTEQNIRVLCVDDQRIVRDGVVLIVNREPDLRVVAAASTGEVLTLFVRERPDVTLVDVRFPRMTGLDAVRAIRHVDAVARIVVLTTHEGINNEAFEAGAAACLLKDTLPEDLARVIREVHAGTWTVPARTAARPGQRDLHHALTAREVQVLELMAQPMRNKEIAASLGISVHTAHAHMKSIFIKLGVQDRVAALMTARRRGVIHWY